jgi:HAD superfamily hydrolase (TIGR01509 family)
VSAERWPHAIQALIFDLDGVLVDSEPAHHAATTRLVAPEVVTDEEYAQFVGSSVEWFAGWVRDRFHLEATTEEIIAQYDDLVVEGIVALKLQPLDGVVALIDAVRGRELPVAVASQSRPRWVYTTLDGAGLMSHIDIVVSADAVTRAKPEPDIYLHTAKLLGVPPEACIVVEDSVPGVQSAHAAGMFVVQTQQASSAVERQPGAREVIASMRDFDLGWLS